jgi:hypothetical protein
MNNRAIKRRHDQMHPRHDQKTRAVVDQAIAAVPAIGIRDAAEFLSAMNVPPEVAVRTLVYPHKRRT